MVRSHLDPFPQLESEKILIFVRFADEYAIVQIENRDERLMELPAKGRRSRFILLERWIAARAQSFFPDKKVLEAFPFKIIRDADLRYSVGDEAALEDLIVEAIQRRVKAKVVRLEVDSPSYSDGAFFLATSLGLDSSGLYRFNLPLDLKSVSKLSTRKNMEGLCYPIIQPIVPDKWKQAKNIFDLIKKKDILVHHPYDSFDIVIRFLEEAAKDPNVKEIYHSMYRTSQESPIMEALKLAARHGKKVTVYIEIKARFDELNNVRWARELKNAGARIVRPLSGYKVHCKMTEIIREEEGQDIAYLHLGTGNYHPTTARLYTDVGLLTRDNELGEEARAFFSTFAKRKMPKGLKKLLVAPGNLHSQTVRLIKNEIDFHQLGRRGRIIAKMNALVDPDVIEALYKASNAGIKIDLLVRGICCLRPGVKGMSENIRVTSVVDRFLEHSRIYYFRAGGEHKVYLSSADWMPRNFHNRYEIAFPLQDPELNRYIRETLLANYLKDNLRTWRLQPDGSYIKVEPKPTEKLFRSQQSFEAIARKGYKGTALEFRSS